MVVQKTIEHLGKVGDALGSTVAAPIDSLVAGISGKPSPIIRQRSAFLAGEVFKTPFRIAGTLAWGAMTGAAKLAWAGIRNLPIFPIWNEKREEVKAASSNKRVSLANAVDGGKRTKPPVASEERLVA
jgi:hypothetical protein